ncbi:MAG: cytochrome ubiquinol oxidase subunit I [Actinomycetota bacterium]
MVRISALLAARIQMGVALGFHIVLAALGVGMPLFLLFAEWRANRTRDEVWMTMARRWAKAFGVLFAVGAATGTVLSFALGLFWPKLMGDFGGVIGIVFALEGIAFFGEAIFLGIYLYGWDRLSARAHLLAGVPIALCSAASAWLIVSINSWMNTPQGFTLSASGNVIDVSAIHVLFNPAMAEQVVHMLLAAYMVTGFGLASVYALGILKGRGGVYHRRALALGLAVGAVMAPAQVVVGDWAARFVGTREPAKLAALEGQWETQRRAPLRLGGIPNSNNETTPYAIEIPGALSFLVYRDSGAEIVGLKAFPKDERPDVLPVHLAFQVMVAVGFGLVALGVVFAWVWWRKRRIPESKWFLRAVVLSGPAAFLAMETGWVVTEVGRQPWIVKDLMRTADAVTTRPGLGVYLVATVAIYALLGAAAVWMLAKLARRPLSDPASDGGYGG